MPKGVYERKPISKEIIEKRRQALIKVVCTPEYRAKLSRIAKEKGYGKWMLGKKLSKKTCQKISKANFGRKGNSWKGGKFCDKDGYVFIHTGIYHKNKKKRYVLEHRLIMEKHIGRKLKKNEVIHHIDGNPSNNNVSNLKLFSSHSEHMKLHRPKGLSINPRDIH